MPTPAKKPQETPDFIPAEQGAEDFIPAGAEQAAQPAQPEQGFLEPSPGEGTVMRGLKGFGRSTLGTVKGILGSMFTPPDITKGDLPASDLQSYAAMLGKRLLYDPSAQAYQHVEDLANATEARTGKRPRGYELAGKAMASLPILGPWGLSAGERAGKGDVAGAMGEAAGFAAIPEIVKGVPRVGEAFPRLGRAGAALNEVTRDIGHLPVDTANIDPVAARALELKEHGGGNLPPPLQAYTRMLRKPPIGTSGGAPTFATMRDFGSTAGRLSAQDRAAASPLMKGQLKQFAKAVDEANRSTASAAGQGEKYSNAMREYRQASKLRDYGKTAAGLGATALIGYKLKHLYDQLLNSR